MSKKIASICQASREFKLAILTQVPFLEFCINLNPFPYRKSFHNHIQSEVESSFLVLKINIENNIAEKITEPVVLDVTFFMSPPGRGRYAQSNYNEKDKLQLHLMEPSLDKLNKTIIQCLNMVEKIDRKNIVSMFSSKMISDKPDGEGYIRIEIFKVKNDKKNQ